MTGFKLVAANDVAAILAGIFNPDRHCRLQVLEESCFKDQAYMSLGEISLYPSDDYPTDLVKAVKKGNFQWQLPSSAEATRAFHDILNLNISDQTAADKSKADAYKKAVSRISKGLDSLAGAIMRLGLIHPRFDPGSVEEMSALRGTTVVADTSAVLQGGLDFVARFLHPVVRMKVPAVVHMEILNLADNFFKRRRAAKINAAALLFEHLRSQVGQRALLSLEIRGDAEIERTPLIGDPLRTAFIADKDQEVSDLNLTVAFRSYCDRLILEAARQHQSYSSPGHRVLLLTADQGLARMALAEGISPLYQQTVHADHVFGRTLSGTVFNPLTADLYRVPLQSVLWEMATAFGKARLISSDGSRWVEVAAIGSELTWSPLHSRNDLLWVRSEGLAAWAIELPLAGSGETAADLTAIFDNTGKISPSPPTAKRVKKKPAKRTGEKPLITARMITASAGYYRFHVERMLRFFVMVFEEGGKVSVKTAQQLLETETPDEYRRFVEAGHLVNVNSLSGWELTEDGVSLAIAIKQRDLIAIAVGLCKVPSINIFIDALKNAPIGVPFILAVPERSKATYKALGEIVSLGAPIADHGYFPTYAKPNLAAFVDMALERFRELDTGDKYVSVGAWLEALIQKNGVHPVRSREALGEASAANLLRVSTEGSTLDTRHDRRAIQVLKLEGITPMVENVHLYRGDFLVPNKSSSSIRLERSGR